MQQIFDHVYIENSYPGVVLGLIVTPHGQVMIDAPFRPDDIRLWRSAMLNLGGGVERLLINLDVHADRTIGSRAMECTVVGHEKMAEVFRNRPMTFKAQGADTGADWEYHNGLGSIRWAPPEISFTQRMKIHWDEHPLLLEYHPGPAAGAIWVILENRNLIFLGDAVVVNQPPFLAGADIPQWLETLQVLLTPQYQNHLLVSGRSGLITHKHVHQQIEFLKNIQSRMDDLAARKGEPSETHSWINDLLSGMNFPAERKAQYYQRLKWGLEQYYNRHYRAMGEELDE
ncbi:MBL fold metallo-hydrolase [Bellilinea sp.]|uniref:Metallo-beta-lactamase domain-containing protein n=1 Tax=Bellilinea caldifistulae TaxID=360411 RepID=A0A7C4Q519_9CHLR|nr:MBL fold metallo-hydrolase [Bellilinea sp.]